LRLSVRARKGHSILLIEMHSKLVGGMLSENDKPIAPTLAELSKAQRPLRLMAFRALHPEGVLANEDEPRIRELREASGLERMARPRFRRSAKPYSLAMTA